MFLASETEAFTSAVDGQRDVLIQVVQGDRELARDDRSLARFDLKDIDPMPAGMARIEVKCLIDANGILKVTARNVRTGDNAEADFNERQLREARAEVTLAIIERLNNVTMKQAENRMITAVRGALKGTKIKWAAFPGIRLTILHLRFVRSCPMSTR